MSSPSSQTYKSTTTPWSQAQDWSQRLKREMMHEKRWRERDLAKASKELGLTSSTSSSTNNNRFGTTTSTATIVDDDAQFNKQRQERNAIAEESLARFPPRRDRSKLLPLDRSRGCGLPEMPRNQLVNREKVKQQDASLGIAMATNGSTRKGNHIDVIDYEKNVAASAARQSSPSTLAASPFQSTNRQVYSLMNVTNPSTLSMTQAAINQTSQRGGVGSTNFGRKPMIKNSFFRKIGGNILSDSS